MRRSLVLSCVIAASTAVHAGELPRTIGLHPRGAPALAMVESKVEVTVRGPIAEAVVTQKFVNRTDHATEATYVFPLPMDAAVSAMAIKYGARTIKATIAKREDAQKRYEDAVRAGVGAALLDQERPDVFTQTVSAIPARGSVEITLRFDTLARYQNGTWELVLPLVVAPRYVPGRATNQPTTGTGRAPDTNRAPDASRVTPAGAPGAGGPTEVVIKFADKPTDVASPTHEIKLAGSDATFVDPKTDHDAIVRWKSTATAVGWVEPASDGGFAAVVVEAPPAQARKGTLRCMLVLDRSAASRGDADAVARPLVRTLLGALGNADRVAVGGSDRLAWGAPADIARMLEQQWRNPAGAFDLTRVLVGVRPQGAPIVLVTGGLVADDRAAIEAARKVGVAIHVIGVGPAPARGLLAQVAAASGGTLRFAMPGDDLAALVKATLADATTQPQPLTVTWGTLAASEVVPGTLPRLGTGQATLVLARVRRAQTANARTRGELIAIEVQPAGRTIEGATTTLGPLARRWARNRLDELLHARAAATVVTAHAMRYGLVSPYTSMVAIGDEVVVQGGVKRSVAIPVSVPAGMKWQEVKRQTTVDIDGADTAPAEDPKPVKDASRPPPPEKKPAAKADRAANERAKKKVDVDRDYTRNVPAPASRQPVTAGPARPEPTSGVGQSIDLEENAPRDDGEGDEDLALDSRLAPKTIALAGSAESGAEIAITSEITGRRWRIATGAGGGILRSRGETASLLKLDARIERGIARGLLVGVDTSLWLVDGEDVAGHVLLSVARYGIARWFELGFGAGVQIGDGAGLAGSLSLRFHLPMKPRAAAYLRYDGALITNDAERRGQNTGTFGIEYGF